MTEERRRSASILLAGGIGILPTDTLYGLVASATNRGAVEKVYRAKQRTPSKPVIILIQNILEIKKFGITLTDKERKVMQKLWPNAVSIIISRSFGRKFRYLHRGTNTLAFRLPKPAWLRQFLQKTGPLIAPSANLEGAEPVKSIAEAKKVFGSKADFYIGSPKPKNKQPSTLVELNSQGRIMIRRLGAYKIPKSLLYAEK